MKVKKVREGPRRLTVGRWRIAEKLDTCYLWLGVDSAWHRRSAWRWDDDDVTMCQHAQRVKEGTEREPRVLLFHGFEWLYAGFRPRVRPRGERMAGGGGWG